MHDDLRQALADTPELQAELRRAWDAAPELRDVVEQALRTGGEAIAAPEPLRLSEWADKHFYLSAESSYVEGRWRTWPFQRAILDCMGNDDIRSVTFKKSARVGYTKMLLACVGYMAQHKRRNQVVYQPTDDDAEDWVKTELDTMLRDVPIMAKVFPSFLRRSKENTLKTKSFLGSKTHVRGGKAAKNYRRLTVDVVYLDELDGFDRDIEKEGSPTKLSAKRLEGATFPKHIKGSTPKLEGFSLTDEEFDAAEQRFTFRVPCPHCDHEQPLDWGGKTARHGFKWQRGKPDTVQHICAACGVGFTQGEYLGVWERGRWVSQDGTWIDAEGRFRTPAGDAAPVPASVAFYIWTAYSPQATWQSIVEEFLEAARLLKAGDHTAMKTWTNTTRGLSFKLEGSKTNADVLRERAKAETYRLRLCPRACLLLTAFVDVQDNRLVSTVWGWGRGEESWVVDDRVIYGDPGLWPTWLELDAYLSSRWPHEGGQRLALDAVGIDTGGHYTHQVYRYVMLRESRRFHATKGDSVPGKPIVAGTPRKQDVNADGQIVKDGVKLWFVGTDTAKDLLFNRLRLAQPGPGYIHMSSELGDAWFDEITAEERVEQRTARGTEARWVNPGKKPNERTDTAVGNLFLAARLKLHQYLESDWDRLEKILCPPTADLFAAPVVEPLPAAPAVPVPPAAVAEVPLQLLSQPRAAPVRRVRGSL